MASRFWVGGNGTWDNSSTANWATSSGGSSGASAPTSSDDVTIDANSGAWTALTIASTAACLGCTITGTAIKTHVLSLSGNFSPTGTLSIQGNSDVNRIFISSNTMGTARTITATVGTMANVDFQDITGAGAGSWNLASITGNSGDAGGNSSITLTTPAAQTWTNVNGGNWSTAANWTSRVPLPQDSVSMSCAFGASKTVTLDMVRCGAAISWTGATWTTALTLASATNTTNFGSVTLIAGLSFTGTASWTMAGRSSHTFDTKALTLDRQLSFNSSAGTYTLAGAVTIGSTRNFGCVRGTLDTGSFAVSCGAVTISSNGTFVMGSSTVTITGTGTAGAALTLTGTITAGTSTIKLTDTTNTAVTISINSRTLYNIWISRGASTGSITLTGSNTFNNWTDDGTAAHSFIITAGTTQTFTNFTVNGTAGNLITLTSTTTATYAFIRTTGTAGVISVDYLDIAHCVATPPNTWFAGAHSTDTQGTATAGSGWLFTIPPDLSIIAAYDVGQIHDVFTDTSYAAIGY